MQEIYIAKILSQKRREKGISQEALAKFVGVSKAAVSKWEQGQSYPDISLLPRLAAYFNMSIDDLMGYTPQLSRKDIRKLYSQISADFVFKPFDTVIAECKSLINKYYSCFPLLYQMAVLFVNHSATVPRERRYEILVEAVELCNRVVSESSDPLLEREARHLLCFCYSMLNKPEDILVLLGESLEVPSIAEDVLISKAYKLLGNDDMAKEIAQCGMYAHSIRLIESAMHYIALTDEHFEVAHTVFQRTLTIIDVFNVENLNTHILAMLHLTGANMYRKNGDRENALAQLDRYADLCINTKFPIALSSDDFFTDIGEWLDNDEVGAKVNLDERIWKKTMLHNFKSFESFAILHNEPRYVDILMRITKYADSEILTESGDL